MTSVSTGEKRREDEDYQYTDISILRNKKRRNLITIYLDKNTKKQIYVPEYLQDTMDRLRVILKREGRSLSQWFKENMQSYVRLHEPGNPQQRIDVLCKTGKPYRAKPLCACGRKATRKVTLESGEVLFCCGLHFPKRDVKGWKEVHGNL